MSLLNLRIVRKRSDTYLEAKSPWLEEYWKGYSRDCYGSVRTKEVPTATGEGVLYELYAARELPRIGSYSLSGTFDVLNNYGWIRAVGISKGISLPIHVPVTKSMASELAERMKDVVQLLWVSFREAKTEDGSEEELMAVEITE